MGAQHQKTVASAVYISGCGLHTGAECSVTLLPAAQNTGIRFLRLDADLSSNPEIVAHASCVSQTSNGTTLANEDAVSIATVEHLMAAIALCEIDNLLIETSGPEIPILDGSAQPFVDLIEQTGTLAQPALRESLVVRETLSLEDKGRSIVVEPANGFSIDVEIDFDDAAIGRQSIALRFDSAEDAARVASARTFCRLHEVEALRRMGLARGGSLENSIVVDGDKVLNDEPLRDEQEFVLHKALDLLGDFYLAGGPLRGKVRAVRPGHDLNTRMAALIAKHAAATIGEDHSEEREEKPALAAIA